MSATNAALHYRILGIYIFRLARLDSLAFWYEKGTTVPRTVKFKGTVNCLQLILLSELSWHRCV